MTKVMPVTSSHYQFFLVSVFWSDALPNISPPGNHSSVLVLSLLSHNTVLNWILQGASAPGWQVDADPFLSCFSPLEKGLSLLGYHLCNYTLTRSVFKMVAYQESYEKETSCGGWIPWMVCPRTHYRTQFRMVEVPETITLTDCCEGYEQVGLYCSLGKF